MDDSLLSVNMLSSAHNASVSELESSSMVAVANSTVGAESTFGVSSMYDSPSMPAAAKHALASISAALSPLSAGPGNTGRQVPGNMSRVSGRDQYSVLPATVLSKDVRLASRGPSSVPPSLAQSMDVGSKRMRESFAPEPSPILASDRSHVGALGGSARPTQRRRILQHSTTVKKIMDIIKDTSTSHTDARYVLPIEYLMNWDCTENRFTLSGV